MTAVLPIAPRAGSLDAAAVMRLSSLELRVRAVVDGQRRGQHRSRAHGFSPEFTELRPYVQGDDLRFLDWRQMARTERAYIKRFEDETNVTVTLVCDVSASMAFGGSPPSAVLWTKWDWAATLAGTLAALWHGQGDAVGLASFAGRCTQLLPARNRPGHLRRMLLALAAGPSPADVASNPGAALEQLLPHVHRRAVIVVVSDFLAPLATLETPLAMLRAAGHTVSCVQVLDPAERSLNFEGAMRLRDLETGASLPVQINRARPAYLEALQRHQNQLANICLARGIYFRSCSTDESFDGPLFDLANRRQRETARPR